MGNASSYVWSSPKEDTNKESEGVAELRRKVAEVAAEKREHEQRQELEKDVLENSEDHLFDETESGKLKDLENYLTKIQEACEKYERISILVLGMIKSGKSSFIESLTTIAEGKLTNYLIRGEADTTNTVRLDPIHLERNDQLKKLVIWDIPGFQETGTDGILMVNTDETVTHIEDVVKGHIGPTQYTEQLPGKKDLPVDALKKDCVVFVCRAKDIDQRLSQKSSDESFKNGWQKILKTIKKIGMSPLVILTGCDEISKKVKETPDDILRSYNVQKARKAAARFFEVSEMNVLPVINYTDQNAVDQKLHKPLMSALDRIVSSAIFYKEKLSRIKMNHEEDT